MRNARRRLVALEKSNPPTYDFAVDKRDIHAMTCEEQLLVHVALELLCRGRSSFDEHDRKAWEYNGALMAAKSDIDQADATTLRYLASALMTRGRRRRLGALEDTIVGPFQPWREHEALPSFDASMWSDIQRLSAEFQNGFVGANDLICSQP